MATPGEQTDGFANNWAYLKTELQWLERMLLTAVARQRKELKEVDRFSQNAADRATSSWWKGVISLDSNIAYDEYRQPQPPVKATYSQQLEAYLQASQRRGIVLALPTLRDRLHLKEFEKNLVLMALASEVNRRYAQLYRFLQGGEKGSENRSDLPTLDLVLRLLCRNDSEWHTVRNDLMTASPLFKLGLVERLPCPEQTILSSPLKLSEPLVNYLLADQPTLTELDRLLHSDEPKMIAAPIALINRCVYLECQPVPAEEPAAAWSNLVLPPDCLASLQFLTQQIAGQQQAAAVWDLGTAALKQQGKFVLLAGQPGTGKTTAATAIAHALNLPLFVVDLANIDPADYGAVLQEIRLHHPTVLLIKSAQCWLSRSATKAISDLPVLLHQLFEIRASLAAITCFSVHHAASVQLQWQRKMNAKMTLPLPPAADRLQLWQRAFPPQITVTEKMPWDAIAHQLPLTGGMIQRLVQDTVSYAAAIGAATIEVIHLQTICQQYGYGLQLPDALLNVRSKRNSSRNSSRNNSRTGSRSSSRKKSASVVPSSIPDTALVRSLEPLPNEFPAEMATESTEVLSEIPPSPSSTKTRKPSAAPRRKRTESME